MTGNRRIIFFSKNPQTGRVKTRLAKDTGPEMARKVYQRLFDRTLDVLELMEAEVHIFFADEITENERLKTIAARYDLQQGLDLGEKMKNAFKSLFEQGPEPVVIVGGDCPGLSVTLLENAFDKLETNANLVFGPANDGGYYLLGMKRFYPELFTDIKWSTPEVLDKSLKKADQLGLDPVLLQELVDIDTYEDLVRECPDYRMDF